MALQKILGYAILSNMGRPKGLPKTGGRIKGSTNKRSQEFLRVLSRHSYNPIEAILQKYSQLCVEEQIKIDLKLLEFAYPKYREQNDTCEVLKKENISDLTDEQIQERKKLYMSIVLDRHNKRSIISKIDKK